jgi:hypothetical protein
MNDKDFEKFRSLLESDDKECLLVFCGEYFKQINWMDGKKIVLAELTIKLRCVDFSSSVSGG